LIKNILHDSDLAIDELAYQSEAERSILLHQFNPAPKAYPREQTWLSLFAKQVKTHPNKVAIQDQYRSFTYKDLDQRSDQVAAYLGQHFGRNEEKPIAVLMNRSVKLLVVLLGIHKAGRAYVPLDPGFPEERLAYIVSDSQAEWMIRESEAQLAKIQGIDVMDLATLWTASQHLDGPPSKLVTADHTAYIIYTSGTTGQPKGVEIGHQSLLNFLMSMRERPGIQQQDTWYSVTTYAFDISILEFFGPLISGATLYIAHQETLMDPALLLANLEQVQPTILQATPSFFELLIHAGWKGSKDLKVWCGGDLLNPLLARQLLKANRSLWNMYGPTETTIWSACKQITRENEATNIGKAINNTQLYLLDHRLAPVPPGVPAALYIGGEGLAKGYHQKAELTSSKFIPNPFGEGKIYQTGDLGKWNEAGEILFLGRNDRQVKIRGYRIELGDVENALLKLEPIDQVFAVIKADIVGNKQIVVYLMSDTDLEWTVIKSDLRQHLPYYMMPAHFIQLPSFPLTPNGKVDRKALANRDDQIVGQVAAYVAPRNELEKQLVDLWKQVLGVEQVGVKDNFFDLGGHSLSATKLIGLVHHQFEVKFSMNDFFKNVLLEEQAQVI
ncbi:MAG: non-ribosomal peptide synthetase, partial [Bacteroidota bacterium]